MKQNLEPQPGAGAEDVQYRKLETPVHDQIMSRVRNAVQINADHAASIKGSYVFLTPARQASGLETVTAPSSGLEDPALSPEEIITSMSPVPASISPRIAGKFARHLSKNNVLEVD